MFKYNIHTHTSEISPCGLISAEKVVNLHKEAGYAGVVITDHFWPGYMIPRLKDGWNKLYTDFKLGYELAKAEGDKVGLDVIFGMELRFDENANDYLVFGLPDEFVLKNENLNQRTLAEFRGLTRDLDIVIIHAHPFRPWMTLMPPELIDGVEIYNGNTRHDNKSELVMQFARRHNLIETSASDFHELSDLNRGGILTRTRIPDAKELVKVLRSRDFELIPCGKT